MAERRTEADWRRAAEAALKGASLDRLVSLTADGVTLGPLHAGRDGPRAFRAQVGPWTALSRLDHPSPEDFGAQAREDLAGGAEGLTVVFAGSGAAYGYGLARADATSLAKAFDGVPAGLPLQLEVADFAQAEAVAAFANKAWGDPGALRVAFGLDPLGAVARGGAADDLAVAVASLRARGFSGRFAAADGRLIHDAGGTPAQELAYALAAGLAYLRALEDPAALEFRLAADADQFATLAKFRALRLLWARVEEACGLKPTPTRVVASSAWRMTSGAEPFVNVMRAALAAFAAGVGGADAVTLLPFSQPLGLPDAFARRLARNTQLVELRESRLGFVQDPAAGAGGVEALTEGLCEKAWALFQTYEAAGGLEKALSAGLVQNGVAEAAAALKRDVARGKVPITGVSAHPHLDAAPASVLPDIAKPLPTGPLAPIRLSEPFERLRASAGGRIFLAALGKPAAHARRVAFARETFEAGGVAAIPGAGQDEAGALAAEFRASGATLACLCGTDDAYAAQAAPAAAALKAAGARAVYLAGRPGEREAQWRAAGVDGFAYSGMDLVAFLEGVHAGQSSLPSP